MLPNHLILEDKVYRLTVEGPIRTGRAFDRRLVDYLVDGVNHFEPTDGWRTRLGMTEELFEDYPSFRLDVPRDWILFRFLSHFARTSSVHLLAGPAGEVLTTESYGDYLGRDVSNEEAEQTLAMLLASWGRNSRENELSLADIYSSTDFKLNTLSRAINSLKFQRHVEETRNNFFRVNPSIAQVMITTRPQASFDRTANRYFQEVTIEVTDEPFCFVIMPFREEEFPQRVYNEVIKPLVEIRFRIPCRRVDEDALPDRIDNKIYTYLMRAAFVIAEVTTSNPNVFYELGLAHMLEKTCIICTKQEPGRLPFDINRIRAEHYSNDKQLVEILTRSIAALGFNMT